MASKKIHAMKSDDASGTTTGNKLEGLQYKVFQDRYALKDEDGTSLEEYPEQMWQRVARGIAEVEPTPEKRTEWAEKFYGLLSNFKFVPGGRILSGAGTKHQVTYYNCYVVGLGEDPLDPNAPKKPMLSPYEARGAFFTALAEMTDIMSRSGGVGMNLSALPPKGTAVHAEGRGQRGTVRPTVALSLGHPDVERFLDEKDSTNLLNVDLAVIVPPEFDRALAEDEVWTPRWNDKLGEAVKARDLWARVTTHDGRRVTILRPGSATLTIEDSRIAIVEGAEQAAMALFRGEAPIVDFSLLRPKGAYIKTVNGTSSGPVAWMYLYDAVARSDDGASPFEKGVIWFGEIASVITGKTIQQGGCFGPDERIATDKGLIPAKELADRLDSGEDIQAQTHMGWQPFTYVFRNGVKDLYEVTTAHGYHLRVTLDHRMAALQNGEITTIPLRNLKEGNEILLLFGEGTKAETHPDPICSIRQVGPSEVFDFEVAEVHLLVANGIYSSNSRRGALMLMIDDDHPDIEEFISAKRIDPITGRPVMIEHANMSLCISDAFMNAVKADLPWDLKWQGRIVRTVRARDIWDQICEAAWKTAEPGVVFMQRAQEQSPMWYAENIRCTNPCGEQPISAGAVCNLGALNLERYVDASGKLLADDLARDAAYATRFLDDVIDSTPYFSELHVKMQREGTRRIGLGTMGLADALIKMRVAYGSAESMEVIDRIYSIIRDAAYRESVTLAEEKGPCGFFNREKHLQGVFIKRLPVDIQEGIKEHGIRNGVVLTQAPTGTTSLLAGVSSGVEPVYDFVMKRVDRIGEHIIYHPLYQAWRDEHPGEEKPHYFVGAKDLTPEEHVAVQARVQYYTDSSISKTVNGPFDQTVDDVKRLYTLAYDLGCKGVTYYRDGSRDAVISSVTEQPRADDREKPQIIEGPVDEMAAPPVASAAMATAPGSVATTIPAWVLQGKLKPRPSEMAGFTRNVAAPEGKVNITINSDDEGPLEVFINVGRAGSDIAALAEAMGRLISLQLRLPSTMSQEERLYQVANQLRGIGGSRSIGFGRDRVQSLPDAVAQAIYRHLEEHPMRPASDPPLQTHVSEASLEAADLPEASAHAPSSVGSGNGSNGYSRKFDFSSVTQPVLTGNLCPQCGSGAFFSEEGCRKCYNCGHSEC